MKLKKYIKIVIVIIFVLIVLFATYMQTPEGKAKKQLDYIQSNTKFEEETVTLGNTHLWYSIYIGELDSIVVEKSLYHFATKLVPEYYNIQSPSEYYNQNSEIIHIYTGIDNEEDFTKLVNKIKQLKGENLVLEKYTICEDSSSRKDNGVRTVVAIQYENNDQMLITLTIKNDKKDNTSSVIYDAQVENSGKYSTQRDETVITNESDTSKPGRVIK